MKLSSKPRASLSILTRTLHDVVRGYINAKQKNTEAAYFQKIISTLQEELRVSSLDDTAALIQQVIFVNLLGYPTTFAEFPTLELMSAESYSSKRIAYTAASQLWNSSTDVTLMATNRLQKDLVSNSPYLPPLVLTSLPPYLSPELAEALSPSIISMMSSSKPYIRQKAITAFYHICLHHPDSLVTGFPTLRSKLDDPDQSVLFACLTVISELAQHNPSSFTPLIPKLHSLLEVSQSNWHSLRLIFLLRTLATAEPRLHKKLIAPFTTILETTSSITLLFETVRTIVDLPITSTPLLALAANRLQSFLEHSDPNLRFLCLKLYIDLIKIQPKLVMQNKELITECLDSHDEVTRVMALDLLAELANKKTVDGIVDKLIGFYKKSRSVVYKRQISRKVVDICSRNDYELIDDFEWYIDILMMMVGPDCDFIGEQFLDLAIRVPSIRPNVNNCMFNLLSRNDLDESMYLIASNIIGEYSGDFDGEGLLTDSALLFTERVQVSLLTTGFKVFLRGGKSVVDGMERMRRSQYEEVQDVAEMMLGLIRVTTNFDGFEGFISEFSEGEEEIEVPAELNEPLSIFAESFEKEMEFVKEDSEKVDEIIKKKKKKIRSQVKKETRVEIKPKKVKQETEASKKKGGVLSEKLAAFDLSAIVNATSPVKEAPKPEQKKETKVKKHKKHHKKSQEVTKVHEDVEESVSSKQEVIKDAVMEENVEVQESTPAEETQ